MKKLFLSTAIILVMALINVSYADGLETFENYPEIGNSYQDGTFPGLDGSTWEYWQCRGDQPIDEQSPCLGKDRTPTAEVTSGTISGGFGTISFDYMQAFSTGVNLDVFVNDILVGNVTSSGEQGVVLNSGDITVDIEGDVYISFIQNNSGAGQVSIDNFAYTSFGGGTPDPEPTNYPTTFTATANATDINLSWTDATGDQLPSKYIIFGGTSASLPVPVDGTPITNDADLSDGSGALNISYGVETAMFAGLTANTTYYFTIYPYTNFGTNVDYKTDGTAPADEATIGNIVVVESHNFDDYSFGNWTKISVIGDQEWVIDSIYGVNGTPCTKMSGYAGGSNENEDWLISPMLNLDTFTAANIAFANAMNYTGNDLELKVSTDYDGGGDPNSATWTSLSYTMSPGSWSWVESGTVDLSTYIGPSVYVAFFYTSTADGSATWEIDNIVVKGETEVGINNLSDVAAQISVFPNPSSGMVQISKSINGFSHVRVMAITGSIVKQAELNSELSTLDLRDLETGIYFMTFSDENSKQQVSKKLIIQ
ncbi:MAG: T9SS type A sorting domain-containing protein [Chlorobi bacterium]|nr:T9SS type A sorting domain-containing protein [Chlorobiota bacterium]